MSAEGLSGVMAITIAVDDGFFVIPAKTTVGGVMSSVSKHIAAILTSNRLTLENPTKRRKITEYAEGMR